MNRITDYNKLTTDITDWIKQYATDNNIRSLVVGVSGGVDSAVVSMLCAMTGIETHTITLPIGSREEHVQLALSHMSMLCDKYPNVTIGCNYNMGGCLDVINTIVSGSTEHALINTKSRLRMVLLYHVAANTNGIVVGTGNKVEDFGIGFYTKYGDGGVDISPIADLYKTEVRELGRYLGISEEILNAAPTDGLFADGRTDEDQIGCTYEELEWAMDYNLITHLSQLYTKPKFEELTQRQQEVVHIYRNLNRKNQHKMLPIPIFKLNQ